ncbi:acyl-CoA mutase large subunit family protein [Hydrogenophaga sp. BPS33]|uniref:acyl-CoA mutase large subunit family protein n=1 Tax=Hydrogenophaga sp. BPS33 TaxID=2651974 RepID=UPI00131FAAA7|nr:methylmalonyl-CoA mutase family protein [Hydrogenophaga sp. BPS33]QHE83699.1 methylmalonyl-CoA mutase [Hydrogenophaga sp. BPS33]
MSKPTTPPYDAWLERHGEQLSQGRKPVFQTPSGLTIDPVYTPDHLAREGWDYERDVGYPGEQPYTRGFTPSGYRAQLWKTEMYAGFGSAEDANQRYRYLMSQGTTGGISIALDLPTQIGYDSDHEMARDEVGQIGVALTSLDDVERVFEGIPLEQVGHIFSTANAIGPIVCAWLLALYEKRGTPTGDCIVQLQNDPIKEYVARGTQFLPIEAALKLTTDMIQHCRTAAPEWLPISVSGSHMKQAGASCVQEAAFTICNGIAYVESCLARGMQIDDFGHVLELHFCTEMDFFEEVAKYRAVRKVWTRLVRERFGGTTERAQRFRLHAATSGRPLTAQQPLNNIARITLQALAQILGGCEQTRTASFDEALGIPTQEAARTSIRANQIIAYESGVPDTVDPLGGSYYLEHLTLQYERRIDAIIAEVDAMGGSLEAVRQGYFQRALSEGAYREACAIESGEQVVVGVNRYQSDEPAPMPTFKVDPTAAERQVAKLQAVRARRDAQAVEHGLARLKADCAAGANVMPALLECVKAYATIGEIADVWREVFGVYVPEAVRF